MEDIQRMWLWRPMGFDYRASLGLVKQTLAGHNQTLCTPGPRRKRQWPHKRQSETCLCVMESPMEAWVDTGLLPGQGNWLQQSWEPQCHDVNLFQGHHYPCHSLASGQTTGREQFQPTVENWIKDLLSMASPTREMQFSPQPVPSIRKLPEASSPHLYGADRIKTTITEN